MNRTVCVVLITATAGAVVACNPYQPTPSMPLALPPPVVVDATPTPTPPVSSPRAVTVNLIVGPSNPMVGQRTAFTALAVTSLAEPATYKWAFGDGETETTTTNVTHHSYRQAGLQNASVRVDDAQGRNASAKATVQVVAPPPEPNFPPPPPPPLLYAVAIIAVPNPVVVTDPSTLTVTATPKNGAQAATSYDWDCNGDGTIEATTALNVRACTFAVAGTMTPKVTAKGPLGASGFGTASVNVLAAPALTVGITPSSFTPALGADVTFTATVTSSGQVPAMLQWQWDDTNNGIYEVTIPSAASPNPRITAYGSTGAKTVKVLVTDVPTGRTASSTLTITVQ